MNTAVYAIMHFFVDFVCAWAIFGHFLKDGYSVFLIYNFCAFALQMPLGTMLDLCYKENRRRLPVFWTAAGVVLTVLGALLHPAMLGLGNALFHVGGGFDVIQEDFSTGRKGKDLGVFVAPGSIGLFLGTQLGKGGTGGMSLVGSGLALVLLLGVLLLGKQQNHSQHIPAVSPGRGVVFLVLCCFLVVILRSFVGMSVSFSWKTGSLYPWLAVFAVALGKVSGGILASRFGAFKTVLATLLLAAVCFLFGETPVLGLAALCLFNMSMPVTLYLLACRLPRMPGFSFGLLTFGLFLGFLPVYEQLALPWSGGMLGAIGSILSAVLLTAAGRVVAHGRISV